MTYPIKSDFSAGTRIRKVSHKWYNWVGEFFRKTHWRGLKFTPTSSGGECFISVNTGNGLAINPDTNDVYVKIGNGIKIDGNGDVVPEVDNVTIYISGGKLQVQNSGITTAKLANNCVNSTKTFGPTGSVSCGSTATLHFANGLLSDVT